MKKQSLLLLVALFFGSAFISNAQDQVKRDSALIKN